jgi:hypothetical protein
LDVGCWVITQGLVYGRKVLYYLGHAPQPFCFVLFLRQSLDNSTQVGLELLIFLELQIYTSIIGSLYFLPFFFLLSFTKKKQMKEEE